jgi:hypothetical protein
MDIITETEKKVKPFELGFILNNANGSEFMDYDLPTPNYIYQTRQNAIIYLWLIEGYFGTKANREYLNDIIARFLLSYSEYEPKRMRVLEQRDQAHKHNKICKLADFSELKSIKKRATGVAQNANLIGTKDQTFWAIKFFAEYLIKNNGICTYDDLIDYAEINFEDKEKSTLRAKARSVFNWYAYRNFETGRAEKKYTDLQNYWEETKMTRVEHMNKINRRRTEDVTSRIEGLINGLFADDYKKPSGKWNITKIANDLKIHRNTVSKYLS